MQLGKKALQMIAILIAILIETWSGVITVMSSISRDSSISSNGQLDATCFFFIVSSTDITDLAASALKELRSKLLPTVSVREVPSEGRPGQEPLLVNKVRTTCPTREYMPLAPSMTGSATLSVVIRVGPVPPPGANTSRSNLFKTNSQTRTHGHPWRP